MWGASVPKREDVVYERRGVHFSMWEPVQEEGDHVTLELWRGCSDDSTICQKERISGMYIGSNEGLDFRYQLILGVGHKGKVHDNGFTLFLINSILESIKKSLGKRYIDEYVVGTDTPSITICDFRFPSE